MDADPDFSSEDADSPALDHLLKTIDDAVMLGASLHLPAALREHFTWAFSSPTIRLEDMLLLDAGLPPLRAMSESEGTEVLSRIIGFASHEMAVVAINQGRLKAKWDEGSRAWFMKACDYLKWRTSDPVWLTNEGKPWPPLAFIRADVYSDDANEELPVLPSQETKQSHVAAGHAQHWEEVFGAALACLAAWPDLCRKNTGNLNLAALIRLMEEKAPLFWRDEMDLPFDRTTIERKFRFWLKKTRYYGHRGH